MESACRDRKTNVFICVCACVCRCYSTLCGRGINLSSAKKPPWLFFVYCVHAWLPFARSHQQIETSQSGIISCITWGMETVQPFHQPLHYYQLTWVKCELHVKSCHAENKNSIAGHHHAVQVVMFETMTSIGSFKRLSSFCLPVLSLKEKTIGHDHCVY